MSGILSANGVSRSGIQKILTASRAFHSLSRIGAGRRYEVAMAGDRLKRFIVHLDDEHQLRIYRTRGGVLRARLELIPYDVEIVRMRGRVRDSLFRAVAEGGAPPAVAMELGDIFGYVIDFHKDLQEGDRIEALIERRTLDERVVGFGRVLAAEFIVAGRKHAAIYFDHKGGDYYTPAGETLRRAFLRSPLRYTRISSRFSRRRFHPVLKRFRPHFGVDYAAPRGTPVRAVADGVITWAGWRGQAGKTIQILHGGSYRTSYLHLSRIRRGVRRGRSVKQGQVIGRVGSTGLSTGPHLDYRITLRGRPLDPLTAKLPKGMPLPPSLLKDFRRVVDQRRMEFASMPLLGAAHADGGRANLAAVGRARPLF